MSQYTVKNKRSHFGIVSKTDFSLGGMDIYIDYCWINLQKKDGWRKPALGYKSMKSFNHSIRESSAVHRPSIYKEYHFLAGGTALSRFTQKAGQP